ncbi:hypothetical protein FHT44_005057 [Mycolicibacterium sp. BK634]|nr:hypothetical protein [Mycolicibacterium sp. BK634]
MGYRDYKGERAAAGESLNRALEALRDEPVDAARVKREVRDAMALLGIRET